MSADGRFSFVSNAATGDPKQTIALPIARLRQQGAQRNAERDARYE